MATTILIMVVRDEARLEEVAEVIRPGEVETVEILAVNIIREDHHPATKGIIPMEVAAGVEDMETRARETTTLTEELGMGNRSLIIGPHMNRQAKDFV